MVCSSAVIHYRPYTESIGAILTTLILYLCVWTDSKNMCCVLRVWVWKCVPVDPVYARALIQTGHAGTFINVDLTVLTLETGHALTRVCGDVVSASGAILAGMQLTLVNLHIAVNPCRGQSRDGSGPRHEIGNTPNYLSTRTDTTQ